MDTPGRVEGFDVPADRAHPPEEAGFLQCPTLSVAERVPQSILGSPSRLADGLGDLVGQSLVMGIQVDVDRDQELACAHHSRAPTRDEGCRPETGCPFGPGELHG